MAGAFVFPPPPPPPRRAQPDASQYEFHSRSRGGLRRGGRGRGGFETRGRGRGNDNHHNTGRTHVQSSAPGQHFHQSQEQPPYPLGLLQTLPPGTFVNPNFVAIQHRRGESNETVSSRRYQNGQGSQPESSNSPPRTVAGHKRKLEALRSPQPKGNTSVPEPVPPTPSFGAPILPPKPPSQLRPGLQARPGPQEIEARSKSVGNALGLTPGFTEPQYSSSDDDAEDDDIDEEALHAELGAKLTFEHNGVVTSLTSAADLKAWQDERRRLWPTKERMAGRDAERYRVGEERRRLLSAAALLRRPPVGLGRSKPTSIPKSTGLQHKKEHNPARPQMRTESKLSRMRKELADGGDNVSEISLLPADLSALTAGSDFASDSDAPPEETTTKLPTADGHLSRPICRFFSASGHCREGDACSLKHELPSEDVVPSSPMRVTVQRTSSLKPTRRAYEQETEPAGRRKTIRERLMKQQQEVEDRLALQVIKHIGRAGLFAENGMEGSG